MELLNGVQTDDLKLLVENGGDYWQVCFARWHYAFISKHFRTCNCSHFVEPLLGRKNYFILYILSGLCGSLASIWWYPIQ
jgi:rhomboid protease GluP